MNKSNNNEQSAQTEADSNSTADNQQVSQPNANTNVVGSLFKSRDIKFRGQRQSDGKWVYGFLYRDEDGEIAILQEETEISDLDGTLDIVFISYKVFSETVGEYTGLKDKNGKEIYEGDIVSQKGWLDREIWFEDGSYLIGLKNMSDEHFFQAKAECVEVIGNIFENPELLQTLR